MGILSQMSLFLHLSMSGLQLVLMVIVAYLDTLLLKWKLQNQATLQVDYKLGDKKWK